jgi:hypothetical protein
VELIGKLKKRNSNGENIFYCDSTMKALYQRVMNTRTIVIIGSGIRNPKVQHGGHLNRTSIQMSGQLGSDSLGDCLVLKYQNNLADTHVIKCRLFSKKHRSN